MSKSSVDWSNLPRDLPRTIGNCLHARHDILRFRAVCNSFRSSLPSPAKPLPWLSNYKILLPNGITIEAGCTGPLVISESTVYAVESIKKISAAQETAETRLLKVQESDSGKVKVQDQLFRICFQNFPEMLPKCLNLLDYQVKELTQVYQLEMESNKRSPSCFRKAIVSRDSELAVMALINGGRVDVWRSRNKTWATIDKIGGDGFYFEDIIYHNKKFYISGSNGRSITVDPKYLNITEAAVPFTRLNRGFMCFVKWYEDLYLIDKYWLEKYNKFGFRVECDRKHCAARLDIYKLDEEKCEWIKVNDGFKDRALFLSEECSIFLPAEKFYGCKGNCIYLFDKDLSKAVNIKIFDLENDSVRYVFRN